MTRRSTREPTSGGRTNDDEAQTVGDIPSEVATAREALLGERSELASWHADLREAEAQLDGLRSGAGEAVLGDRAAADRIAKDMRDLRDRIDLAERAIVAQGPRVRAAESAYLHAEAAVFDAAAAAAREALDVHQVRTGELLKLLAEHEGVFEAKGQQESHALHDTIAIAEKRAWILRELADGHDPHPTLLGEMSFINSRWYGLSVDEVYPTCITAPDAVVRSPAVVRAVDAARVVVSDLEGLLQTLPREIEQWEERAQRLAHDSPESRDALGAAEYRRSRLAEVPAELEDARRALAEMTGDDQAAAAS